MAQERHRSDFTVQRRWRAAECVSIEDIPQDDPTIIITADTGERALIRAKRQSDDFSNVQGEAPRDGVRRPNGLVASFPEYDFRDATGNALAGSDKTAR
jgi:hypothetical protein